MGGLSPAGAPPDPRSPPAASDLFILGPGWSSRRLEARVKPLGRSERSTGCLVPLDYPSVPSDTVAGRVLAGTRRVLAGTIFYPRIYKTNPSATQVQTAAHVPRLLSTKINSEPYKTYTFLKV